ncbi:MAG: aldehyde dehydrogenase [Candidatus Dormiibacterota bacterium]
MTDRPPLPPQRDLVDGEWIDAPLDGVPLVDPDTGEELARSATSTAETVERALAAAARDHAAGRWAECPIDERAVLLLDLANRLDDMRDEFAAADAFDSGVPIAVTGMFAAALAGIVRDAVEHAHTLMRERVLPSPGGDAHLLRLPWGPAAVLAPFNAPGFTAVKKSAYALAAGCPVLLKPSQHSPHSAGLLATAMAETIAAHDAPRALFQILHGEAEVGMTLASDRRVRCLTFTGSRRAGRSVASAAAQDLKALQLECGSNNPAIVCADADVNAAAEALALGFTKLNGQWCERPGTVFVAAQLHDALLDALRAAIGRLRPGSCLDPATTFGPQANRQQADAVTGDVRRLETLGATAHIAFTDHPSRGCFVRPVVVTGARPADTIEEIFGPVLVLHAVQDEAQALELAAHLAGGLAAYVFTADVQAGVALGARVAAGEVKINGASVLDLSPESAQSFWNGSGIGGHGNADLLRFFTGTRIVGPDLPGAAL